MDRLKQIHKTQAIWACIFAFGLSFCTVVGWIYDKTSFLTFTPISIVALVVLFAALCVPFYLLLVRTTCASTKKSSSTDSIWQPSKRDLYIALAIMVIPQLILWLIAWPGIYNHDGPFHVLQLNSTPENHVDLGNKYSVIYTVLLGGAVRLAKPFGFEQVAFAAVMFLQAAVAIYAQFKACLYVGRQSASKAFFWIVVFFFGLHPFIMVLRVTSCQDVLFGAFLLLAIIESLEVGKSVCAGKNVCPRCALKLIVFITLMCLMRNNGLYFYAFALVFMVPLLIKNKLIKTGGVLVLPIAIVLVISGPIYKACGVVDSGTALQEMLSVPSQQIARALASSPENFSEEDMQNVNKFYYDMGNADFYWENQGISDDVKGRINAVSVKENLTEYINFYVSAGLKNASAYVDAFAMNTLGWWYPLKKYHDDRILHHYVTYKNTESIDYHPDFTPINRMSACPILDKIIEYSLRGEVWNYVPWLRLVLDTGIYSWAFITLCVIAALNRRRDVRFAFLIIGGLFITYMLSPLCYFRYSYSMITCIPVLALVCFKASSVRGEAAGRRRRTAGLAAAGNRCKKCDNRRQMQEIRDSYGRN